MKIVIVVGALLLLAFPGLSGAGNAANPPSVNVSNDAQASSDGHVAVSGSHVYSVWTTSFNGTSQVMFSSSSDFGTTWTPGLNLSSDAGPANYARVAAYGSNVYVFWTDKSTGGSEVYFRLSRNYGANWTTTVNLSNTGSPSRHFRIMLQGSSIYIAWVEKLSKNNEVLFTESLNSGTTWSTPKDLSDNVNDSVNIGMEVSGSHVLLTWMALSPTFQILFRSSSDSGTTWGSTLNISNDTGSATSPDIALVTNGAVGNVFVVWQDNSTGNSEIMFSSSGDWGGNWSTPSNLSRDLSKSVTPRVGGQLINGGVHVYVAWADTLTGNNDIYFVQSSNGGATFGSKIDLSLNTGSSSQPRVMVMGHSIYVAWVDSSSGSQVILLATSNNFGTSFGPASSLSSAGGGSNSPNFDDFGSPSSPVFVVWVDSSTGNGDIYLQRLPATPDTLSHMFAFQHLREF